MEKTLLHLEEKWEHAGMIVQRQSQAVDFYSWIPNIKYLNCYFNKYAGMIDKIKVLIFVSFK